MVENCPDLDRRKLLLNVLAAELPLSYTLGVGALKAWSQQPADKPLRIKSASARSVSFYVGPARRYFGKSDDTLIDGRGRAALLIHRRVVQDTWRFSPFDLGEVLYHWRHGRLTNEFLTMPILQMKPKFELLCKVLKKYFRLFLDEGYADPEDYLKCWCPPRPSIHFQALQNAVYRAASDRWFGRVRPFAPAWTFEVRTGTSVEIRSEDVEALVVVRDPHVAKEVPDLESFVRRFDSRAQILRLDVEPLHPDLTPVILESETVRLIRETLKRNHPELYPEEEEVMSAAGLPGGFQERKPRPRTP